MTPDKLREAATVLLAAADGKKIEYTGIHGTRTEWWRHNGLEFYFDTYDYRVKPEPFEVWLICRKGSDVILSACDSFKQAEEYGILNSKIRHMREVEE